jgi:ornithine decarboxylase
MRMLDIGGGFPGDSCEDKGSKVTPDCHDVPIFFDDIAAEITPLMDLLFPPEVTVISEPGRYFATTSHTLAVKVFSRRVPADVARKEYKGRLERERGATNDIPSNDLNCLDVGEQWKLHHLDSACPNILYYINDGLYGSFNCVLYDHATITPEILKCGSRIVSPKDTRYPSTIFGQTCDGFDCIIKSVELPKLEVGDWLVFRNMGAYTVAAASNFNGFSKPYTRYVHIVDDL